LLGLLLLIAIALALYFALRGDDDPKAAPAPSNAATTAPPATSSGAPSTSPTAAGSPGTTGGAAAGGTAAGTANGGLVGGGTVPAAPAAAGSPLAAAGAYGTVLFAENSSALDAQGQKVIAAAVTALRQAGTKQVLVSGYTDVVGGQPVNGSLSKERADRVAAALRQQIPGLTVETAARGEADPVQPNDTAEHRQLNRRATITAR
jgi:outer membrane protein OmpA-like peptidoglycan-associated protein